MTPVDIQLLQKHVGQRASREDVLDPRPLAQFALTLDLPGSPPSIGDALPVGRHWLYFGSDVPLASLLVDGNANAPPPLPVVAMPRRMWGGGRIEFLRQLTIGGRVRRESEVKAIYERRGQSGPLVFVVLRHEIADENGVAIIEEQDILYRDPEAADAAVPPRRRAREAPHWRRDFLPTIAMLFRYSAITFNAHRIHYDQAFARSEGYEGAVVHGPLLAMLLMDGAALHAGRAIRRLAYRGSSPLFDGVPATLAGRLIGTRAEAWASTSQAELGLTAEIDFD